MPSDDEDEEELDIPSEEDDELIPCDDEDCSTTDEELEDEYP